MASFQDREKSEYYFSCYEPALGNRNNFFGGKRAEGQREILLSEVCFFSLKHCNIAVFNLFHSKTVLKLWQNQGQKEKSFNLIILVI